WSVWSVSTIATITTSGEAQIPPPTIPSIILENLSMFNSAFRFEERLRSASESAYAEEPVQTTCQMEETLHLVFETGADDQPIFQTSQHPEWFSQPRRPPSPDRTWNTALQLLKEMLNHG
nr:hypothetical protein [Tanacetum cinerariifolium]